MTHVTVVQVRSLSNVTVNYPKSTALDALFSREFCQLRAYV